jgi:hypothetical protein
MIFFPSKKVISKFEAPNKTKFPKEIRGLNIPELILLMMFFINTGISSLKNLEENKFK